MKKAWLIFLYSFCVYYFLKIIVGIKFRRAHFLKNTKQFIIVANHNSHLDTMALLAAMPSRLLVNVKPVAAMDHFGKTRLSSWFSRTCINAVLIKRHRDKVNPSLDPINVMLNYLDKGFSLILFPEGSRGIPEIAQPFKAGIAFVLRQRPHIPFLPAYMSGLGKAMPKGDNLIVPYGGRLVFGQLQTITSMSVDDILNQISAQLSVLKKPHKN